MESNKTTIYKVLLSHPETIHKFLDVKDTRVLCVKLADRMRNTHIALAEDVESQRRTVEKTEKTLKRRSFPVLTSSCSEGNYLVES